MVVLVGKLIHMLFLRINAIVSDLYAKPADKQSCPKISTNISNLLEKLFSQCERHKWSITNWFEHMQVHTLRLFKHLSYYYCVSIVSHQNFKLHLLWMEVNVFAIYSNK